LQFAFARRVVAAAMDGHKVAVVSLTMASRSK
jgi:hypothetical protein